MKGFARVAALVLPLAVIAFLGSVVGSFATNFIRVPRVSELATYRPDIVTQIFARDGSTIARYAIERRTLITRADIPAVLTHALVATEDKNFFRHGGVDVRRTFSALVANMRQGGYAQGGSTLTQQLARAIFLSPRKTLSRKVNEALVSFEIERRYSKDQILTMYANEIYLGHGNYGFEAASRYYFGKSVKEITLAEAALLSGIVQRPEDQSPFRNPTLARARRATALRRMRAEGYITEAEQRAAEQEPLPAAPSLPESLVGPYFSEEIRQYLEKTYGEKDLYRRGLRVESTLDPDLQAWSEESLGWGLRQVSRRHGFHKPRNLYESGYKSLESYVDPAWENAKLEEGAAFPAVVTRTGASGAEVRIGRQTFALPNATVAWTGASSAAKILRAGDLVVVTLEKAKDGTLVAALDQEPREQGAVLILENSSGAIRAMVGGSDWGQSKFNRSTQALRQAGSAFKPFVYLTALEQGYTGADTVFDGPLTILIDPHQPPYRPSNYDGKFHGIVTFRKALEHSYNIPAIRVGEMIGLPRVIETAHRLGVRQNLEPYPSLALGAFEVTLMELAGAYMVFANQGLAFSPYLIERVTDANGDVLEQSHPDPREVASPQASFQLLQILRGVTQRGTAAPAVARAGMKLNIAGKTGTTNDWTDAWFIGMTPRYTVAVWVGNDEKKLSIGKGAEGARVALPIWIRILEKMRDHGRIDPQEDFEAPPNVVLMPVDYDTGLKATADTPLPVLEAFVAGSQPTEEWTARSQEIAKLPWSLQEPFYTPKKGELPAEGPLPPLEPAAH
ncbi:MAG TPA: PBP1A family penicillin-binding protein [Thermoanaerobaculia bacterium]|nr:PBP1A family penicillin-binding protein [Thermoanaerobaculia bacterium]